MDLFSLRSKQNLFISETYKEIFSWPTSMNICNRICAQRYVYLNMFIFKTSVNKSTSLKKSKTKRREKKKGIIAKSLCDQKSSPSHS